MPKSAALIASPSRCRDSVRSSNSVQRYRVNTRETTPPSHRLSTVPRHRVSLLAIEARSNWYRERSRHTELDNCDTCHFTDSTNVVRRQRIRLGEFTIPSIIPDTSILDRDHFHATPFFFVASARSAENHCCLLQSDESSARTSGLRNSTRREIGTDTRL